MGNVEVLSLLVITLAVVATYVRIILSIFCRKSRSCVAFGFHLNLAKLCLLMVLIWLAGLVIESQVARLASVVGVMPLLVIWSDCLRIGDDVLILRRGMFHVKEYPKERIRSLQFHPTDEFEYGKRTFRSELVLGDGTSRSLAGILEMSRLVMLLRDRGWPVDCTADLARHEWTPVVFAIPTLSALILEWLFVYYR